ncbi:MAG: UbiA family prenyltransferase [Fimbriiglobus sp.]
MTTNARLLAYAQLMRLPNVFTAFADICMAGAATGAITSDPGTYAWILLASGSLYLFGMVLNDVYDAREDLKTRPFRPIPSGRITAMTGLLIAGVLMAMGLGFASFATASATDIGWETPHTIAYVLVFAIFAYDRWLKHTPVGPVAMGACRLLNVLLGLSAAPGAVSFDLALHLASVIGIYIVGVTGFAHQEETTSCRTHLRMYAGVMLAALVLALAVPLHLPPGTSPWYFPFLLVGFGFLVGFPITAAVRRPEPKFVQTAVKRCILGLVVLDAVLATAFVGAPGLLILLLLPPALLLGKWVYST